TACHWISGANTIHGEIHTGTEPLRCGVRERHFRDIRHLKVWASTTRRSRRNMRRCTTIGCSHRLINFEIKDRAVLRDMLYFPVAAMSDSTTIMCGSD